MTQSADVFISYRSKLWRKKAIGAWWRRSFSPFPWKKLLVICVCYIFCVCNSIWFRFLTLTECHFLGRGHEQKSNIWKDRNLPKMYILLLIVLQLSKLRCMLKRQEYTHMPYWHSCCRTVVQAEAEVQKPWGGEGVGKTWWREASPNRQ